MAAAKSRGKRRKEPKKSGLKTWFWRFIRYGFYTGFALALALVIAVMVAMSSLPSYQDLKTSQVGQTILVRAADGTEIVSLGPSYGKWIPYPEIPQIMKEAMTSVEDRRYRYHIGVDPIAVVRSLQVRATSGYWRQGGSTITQQLARNIFLNNNRTFGRKLREAILALALERKFSKDQILELYLNKVYFGGGAYGIDSASRRFFDHPATQLSLEEAAIIAGLVKAPSRYSPTADAKAAVSRAGVVLQVMAANNTISPYEAANADVEGVKMAAEKGQNSVRYFTDWALPQLDLVMPNTNEPIEVWTTLDLPAQRAATAAIKANAPAGAQGALVSLDRDGAVLAMVGGTDYVTSNYNRATSAVRQPGSAWKLFVYLTALEAGYTPSDIVVDEPVTIDGWTPRNSGGRYAGEISLRTAFAYSKNSIAAQLGNELGYGSIASMARRFGITTPINTHPSMVLGSSEVRVIDMTRAFASISSRGVAIVPYGIKRVETLDGEVLYQHRADTSTVLIPPYVAVGITDLLQTAVNTGTGKAAQIGRPVAGKTGTTNSNKDGWFLGFSSGITTGVWMGRDDAKRVSGLQGGTAPARAFSQFMKVAVAKRPVEEFDTELVLPEWQLEPDDEAYFGDPDEYFMDDYGNPVDPLTGEPLGPPLDASNDPPPPYDDSFLDRATGRSIPRPNEDGGDLPPGVSDRAPAPDPVRPQGQRPQAGTQTQQRPRTTSSSRTADPGNPAAAPPSNPRPSNPAPAPQSLLPDDQ